MASDIYGMSLRDIIPSSIAGDPQIQAMIDALDPELQSVSFDTREALIYSRIDELPENVIDLLAWQFHVDFYEPFNLSLEIKRGLVKTAILIHKHKGTKWAVEELCGIVFGDTKVQPWFEYGGQPYHFNIETETTLPDTSAWSKFFLALESVKSVRDWLDAVRVRSECKLEIFHGIGTITNGGIRLDIETVKDHDTTTELSVGIYNKIQGTYNVSFERGRDEDITLSMTAGVFSVTHGKINLFSLSEEVV